VGENPCTGTSGPSGFRDTQVRTLDGPPARGQPALGPPPAVALVQGQLDLLPIRQPYPAYPASFIGAW